MVSVVIGTQWGDEGKGKIVDLLSKNANFVVRFHGGNNAGHTVIVNDKKYPFHLIPSGVLHPDAIGVIANGVIIDLEVLVSEIENLLTNGINLKKKLVISPRCHLILPYHKALDLAYENARGKNKLGTTGRGIGPCLADKVSYNGIRIYELRNWNLFVEKFTFQAKIKNKVLKTFDATPVNIKKELEKFSQLRKVILPFVTDTYLLLNKTINSGKRVLMEGAHGVMLDTDFSPYPYSTGSNVIPGAVNTGSGIPPQKISNIIGVIKAYTSRVGGGPLPTELHGKLADEIREKGQEYGTTTGRPRRVCWLDLEAVKFACQVSGVTEITITKIDILSGLKKIKVCIGYELSPSVIARSKATKPALPAGRQSIKIPYSSCGYEELNKLTPVYKELPGWKEDITKVKSFKALD